MQNYLRAAADRYIQEDNLIHPISETDCLIFEELIKVVNSIKFEALKDILISYKFEKDEDILDKFIQLNVDLDNRKIQIENEIKAENNKEKKEVLPVRFIKINGRRIDMSFLNGYDSLDFLDENLGKVFYFIKLNPIPDKVKDVPYYANEILKFDNKEERDKVVSQLDLFTMSYKGVFINDFDFDYKNVKDGK